MQNEPVSTLYNLAFERSVLSSILFAPESIMQIMPVLQPDEFYFLPYRDIYMAMCALDVNKMPIDEEFLKKALLADDKFDEKVMLDLMDTNAIANVMPYVNEIKEKSQLRALLALRTELSRAGEEGAVPVDIITGVEKSLRAIGEAGYGGMKIARCPITEVKDGETEWLLKSWLPIPRGVLSMFAAAGGSGKTWIAIQAGFRHALACPHKRVALWLSEDPDYETKGRARAVARDVLNTVFSNFTNVDIITDRPRQLIKRGELNSVEFYKLRNELKEYDMIVLDPLRAWHGGNENDNSEGNVLMAPFQDWAKEENISIVWLHHSAKDAEAKPGSRARGASALVDACRVVYDVGHIYSDPRGGVIDKEQSHMRSIRLSKDNYGAKRYMEGFEVVRQITPKESARETVMEVSQTKVGMPLI